MGKAEVSRCENTNGYFPVVTEGTGSCDGVCESLAGPILTWPRPDPTGRDPKTKATDSPRDIGDLRFALRVIRSEARTVFWKQLPVGGQCQSSNTSTGKWNFEEIHLFCNVSHPLSASMPLAVKVFSYFMFQDLNIPLFVPYMFNRWSELIMAKQKAFNRTVAKPRWQSLPQTTNWIINSFGRLIEKQPDSKKSFHLYHKYISWWDRFKCIATYSIVSLFPFQTFSWLCCRGNFSS